MGVADVIFEPHPPNFENLYNFWRCSNDAKMIFWYLYWFQILEDQCGSVPSIPVVVLGLSNGLDNIDSLWSRMKIVLDTFWNSGHSAPVPVSRSETKTFMNVIMIKDF